MRRRTATRAPGLVRLGIVGTGGMGGWHAKSVREGRAGRTRLAAVCDVSPAAMAPFAGIPAFADSRELIRSGAVDAVLIATPHFAHTPIAIDAMRHGLHVLTEKPMAVHKADALRMIAEHRAHRRLVFAVMFQTRTASLFRRVRALLRAGELGPLQRIQWTVTDWFRADAYYASGGWRATWKGEGGGLLTNQCVHNLDAWQWLFGMPTAVRGWCGLGRYHPIEVEDDVTAYLEYEGGPTGVLVSSTGEAPGVNRLEIAGDRGLLTVEQGSITFLRNAVSARGFARSSRAAYDIPGHRTVRVPAGHDPADHARVIANFAEAILEGEPLIAPAEEGLNQVELSNAIMLSSLTNRTVPLPMPPGTFANRLKALIRTSRRRLGVRARARGEKPRYIVKG